MGCTGSKDETQNVGFEFIKGAKFELNTEHKTGEEQKNKLVLQGDGNLVIYCGDDAKWSTDTCGKDVTAAVISESGDLVLVHDEETVWSAGVEGAEKWIFNHDGVLVAVDAEGAEKFASHKVEIKKEEEEKKEEKKEEEAAAADEEKPAEEEKKEEEAAAAPAEEAAAEEEKKEEAAEEEKPAEE